MRTKKTLSPKEVESNTNDTVAEEGALKTIQGSADGSVEGSADDNVEVGKEAGDETDAETDEERRARAKTTTPATKKNTTMTTKDMNGTPLDNYKRLLSPVPYNSIPDLLGSNISKTQPDVEMLAVTLKTIPTDKSSFHDMLKEEGAKNGGKEKDWISIPLCVLAVGPPGFGSAPYSSTQKKGDAPPVTQPLYELSSEKRETVFYPFDKGRTPKDKGARVGEFKEMPSGFDTLNATAIVSPGFTTTKFLRDENDCFEKGKMFVNAEGDIPENTFVYIQVSSCNVDQAASGRLLKIKKIMPLSGSLSVVDAALDRMCRSPVEYDTVMSETKRLHPSISKLMYTGGQKIYTVTADDKSFCVESGDESAQVIIQDEVYQLPYRELLRATSSKYPSRARRILNVAMARGAVKLLVRSNVNRGVIMDGQKQALLIVYAGIDFNKMLCLPQLNNLKNWPDEVRFGEDVLAFSGVDEKNGRFIVWTTRDAKIMDGDDEDAKCRSLLFCLSLDQRKVDTDSAPPGTDYNCLVADHGSSPYYALDIRYCDMCFGDIEAMYSGSKRIIDLHYRTQYKNNRVGDSHKRKREALAEDDYLDDMVEYSGR